MKISDVSSFAQGVGRMTCLLVVMMAFGAHAPAQAQPDPAVAAPDATPTQTAGPAPTTPSGRPASGADPAAAVSEPPAKPAADDEPTTRIYMPDGQLSSNSIRVYVNRDIRADQKPRLELLRSHAVTRSTAGEAKPFEPKVVALGQEWVESVEGQEIRNSGTLLMFDISNMDFQYKAMLRVTPVVSWTEEGSSRLAVGIDEVNVANIVNTSLWTLLVVGAALALVIVLARRAGGSPLRLLTGAHGHLSLAQTQIACWTVAVGGIVLGYGFVRLQIPEIPASLLALMGASLSTGGIAFFKDDQKIQEAAKAATAPGAKPATAPGERPALALGDLVRTFTPGKPSEPSLAKAQMLFWTVLLLVLYVSKSILDGAIWAVPWPLVALMGFSQAGYLAPKLAPET